MYKKVAKLDRDFHKFLALLGLMTQHYGHRHRSKMLTKHPLPRVSGAREVRRPTRSGMGANANEIPFFFGWIYHESVQIVARRKCSEELDVHRLLTQ